MKLGARFVVRRPLRGAARLAGWAALAAACHPSSPPPAAPLATPPTPASAAPAPRDALAEPPPAGTTPPAPFPAIEHRRLPSGLALSLVQRRTYPIVELRLVLDAGSATDGAEPGAALVCGELLKAGGAGRWNARALVERAAELGSSLDVLTDQDATRVEIGVTTGNVDAALELLAAVVTRPRLAPVEFEKLKQREIQRTESLSRASASWVAAMQLYRELYALPSGVHPYARYDALPGQLSKLTLATCQRWYRREIVPAHAELVAAGDLDPDAFTRAAERAFQGWRGTAPEPVVFPTPKPPAGLNVFVVDRPGSAQSEIRVGLLGPERQSPAWPAVSAANQILGGGVSGRLFLDVREKRSLAYSTGSSLRGLAHARVPLVLSAGTQTAKTEAAVAGLLEHLASINSHPPTAPELETASRYLADSFLFRMETLGAIATLTANLHILGLPDGYYDQYRQAVRSLDLGTVHAAAERYFTSPSLVVVVAGDAERVARPLTRFGQVRVVEPERGFAVVQTLPASTNATPTPPSPTPPASNPSPHPTPPGTSATSAPSTP